ncbi:sigma-70 family RNA polymerase sigma factor [Reichenbachiella agarivorans]|uniref:Sigma-70 family RNA polymerase sigma factor n=1 Tax=Reichenbachiella agarivorans TaxID=2979464 RepID=A0ABY6CK35_9BACT|nr:sigma-70 family RNA polymerase sigma factor [Reichenbachiella agarivorans]UXP30886.1 sigma-70 family RNA polymerase sigma factor [Reichenbachiella agarivorans]
MHTEEHFISLIQNTSTKREGFRLLVKAFEKPLYSVIRKMVIDHDETKDVLQDTFVKVWENLDSFKAESKIYTWVYRVAVNHCLQYLKKKQRRNLFNSGVNEEMMMQLESNESISGDEIQLKLQKAILKLPDKQRLVFNLKYYEEMSYEQMAEITETSSGALRASYHQAVKKIETMIQEG